MATTPITVIPLPSGYYTVSQAASLLGITPRALRQAIGRGAVNAVRYGWGASGPLLVDRDSLNDYLLRRPCTKPGRKTGLPADRWRHTLL